MFRGAVGALIGERFEAGDAGDIDDAPEAALFAFFGAEGFDHGVGSNGIGQIGTDARIGFLRALRRRQEFRGQLPYFELSHHTGKQIIPDTMNEFFYEDTVVEQQTTRRIIRFLSDITGKWEEFPDGD